MEAADTVARARAGGVFYLAGWLLVGGAGGAFEFAPAASVALLLGFLLTGVVRLQTRPPAGVEGVVARRFLQRYWPVFMLSAVLWGVVMVWVHLDERLQPVRTAAWICSVAYATAFAHSFCMRRTVAAIGIALVYGPGLLLSVVVGEPVLTAALAIYLLYLLFALQASHRDHMTRLQLAWDLRTQRDRFHALSQLDPLTGLYNRRAFQQLLQQAAERAFQQEEALVLVLLDLDYFKQLNDRHGHAVGDAVLTAVGSTLRQVSRGRSFAARIGGEEFAWVLPDCTPEQALSQCEVLRAALRQWPAAASVGAVSVSASMGVALVPRDDERPAERAYRAADAALYQAKAAGRDRVHLAGAEA